MTGGVRLNTCSACHWRRRDGRCMKTDEPTSDNDRCSSYEIDIALKNQIENQIEREKREIWRASPEGQKQLEEQRRKDEEKARRERLEREKLERWLASEAGKKWQEEEKLRKKKVQAIRTKKTIIRCIIGVVFGFIIGLIFAAVDSDASTGKVITIGILGSIAFAATAYFSGDNRNIPEGIGTGVVSGAISFGIMGTIIFIILRETFIVGTIVGAIVGAVGGAIIGILCGGILRNYRNENDSRDMEPPYREQIENGDIKNDPISIDACMANGMKSLLEGKFDEAITDFNQAIMIEPKNIEAYKNRGLAFCKKMQWDNAIADYSKIIEFDSNNSAAYGTRGYAFFRMNQFEAAIDDFSKIIEIGSKNADDYYFRGDAYRRTNQWEYARADLEKALQLNPAHKGAQATLKVVMELPNMLGK